MLGRRSAQRLGVNSQDLVLALLAAPALQHSPRDHAAGPCVMRGKSSTPAAREIAARESGGNSLLTAGADQRDFEGASGERLRAGAHIETLATLRAPAAGPPPAGGDERGAMEGRAFRLDKTATSDSATARFGLWRPGRRVPTREAARRRGAFDGNNVLR